MADTLTATCGGVPLDAARWHKDVTGVLAQMNPAEVTTLVQQLCAGQAELEQQNQQSRQSLTTARDATGTAQSRTGQQSSMLEQAAQTLRTQTRQHDSAEHRPRPAWQVHGI